MDQGNKQGLNSSSKKKRMEKTSDDQEKEQLDDPLEQATKRFRASLRTVANTAQLLVAHMKRKEEKQALVLSTKESSTKTTNNPKLGGMINKETDSEETVSDKETDSEETETDQEEEVISLAGSSKNNPKGMKKKLIRGGEEKKLKSSSLSDTACTSTSRILTKTRSSPPGDQGSSCRKNL